LNDSQECVVYSDDDPKYSVELTKDSEVSIEEVV